ncbi:MAG: hypothetical protein M3N35_04395 [Candidatus Binatota bacterium]|nr:hypothetical protein [Candidatus Binatota bacterium]
MFSDRKSPQKVATSYSLEIEVPIQLAFPDVASLLRLHGRHGLRREHGNYRRGPFLWNILLELGNASHKVRKQADQDSLSMNAAKKPGAIMRR